MWIPFDQYCYTNESLFHPDYFKVDDCCLFQSPDGHLLPSLYAVPDTGSTGLISTFLEPLTEFWPQNSILAPIVQRSKFSLPLVPHPSPISINLTRFRSIRKFVKNFKLQREKHRNNNRIWLPTSSTRHHYEGHEVMAAISKKGPN